MADRFKLFHNFAITVVLFWKFIAISVGSVWNGSLPLRFPSSAVAVQGNVQTVRSFLNGQSSEWPSDSGRKAVVALRVMTLNTYLGGRGVEKGLEKIAKHIRLANADIVGLQEINQTDTDAVVAYLGADWTHCRLPQTYWLDVAVVTKKTVLQKYTSTEGFSNLGCQLLISDQPKVTVSVWNVHLNYRNYGPYSACIFDALANDPSAPRQDLGVNEYMTPDDGSTLSRVESIVNLLNHRPMLNGRLNTGLEPVLLLGDFNVPSALDWIYSTRGLHCNRVNEWPVSRILADNGFVDSFRQVHPDAVYKPGITWSPVNYYYGGDTRYLEPQDRIDYIYYKGSRAKAMSSRTYFGTLPVYYAPNNYYNDWPSDHAAVITDFHVEEV